MFEKLNNLTSELNILKMNSSHSSSVPKHVSSPPRRKRCSSVPTSHDGEILTSLSFLNIYKNTRSDPYRLLPSQLTSSHFFLRNSLVHTVRLVGPLNINSGVVIFESTLILRSVGTWGDLGYQFEPYRVIWAMNVF